MRILAIRGTNLASLPEFSIDFSKEPLNRSGLFAITGKTGSGKSTILDALCIALFDKTPRLTGGGAMVGKLDENEGLYVNAGDVRSIIRQGTAGGSAEVDFVSHDGIHYRSTWQARRARNRVEGKFQSQTVTLINLETNQPLGGTKIETLALIRDKIGLSYDQFRRSVLLAQGEFAAFLRADGRERAELLEKITGTDIYARLSVATFNHKKTEEQALEQLTAQLDGITIMNDEERAFAEASLLDLETALNKSRAELAELEKSEGWYVRHDQLLENIVVAQNNLAEAQSASDSLKPLRVQLQLLDSVEKIRPAVADADRTSNAIISAIKRQGELQTSATAAKTQLKINRDSEDAFIQIVAEITKQFEAAKPLVSKARELDARLIDSQKQLEGRTAECTATETNAVEAEKSKAAITEELEKANHKIADADSWFATYQWAAAVATEWQRWKAELIRYATTMERCTTITASITAENKSKDQQEITLTSSKEASVQEEKNLQEKSGSFAIAEKNASNVDIAELRKKIDVIQEQITASKELQRIAEEAQQYVADKNSASNAIASIVESLGQLSKAIEMDKCSLPAAIASRDEAEHSLNLARSSMDMDGQRAALRDGDPCPLCGSHEHPYRTGDNPSSALLASLEERFVKLRDTVTVIENRIATSIVRQETTKKDLVREQKSLADCEQKLTLFYFNWAELAQRLPKGKILPKPFDADSVTAATSVNKEAVSALKTLRNEESAANALLAAMAPARTAMDMAREKRDKAIEAHNKAEQRLREIMQTLENLTRELKREEKELDSLKASLEVPFNAWEGWNDRMVKGGNQFIAEAEKIANLWCEWTTLRATSTAAKDDTTLRLKEAAARCQLLAASLLEKKAAVAEQKRQVEILIDERAAVLDGKPADTVELDFTTRLSAVQEQLRAGTDAVAIAEKEVNSLTGKIDEAQKQLVVAQNEVKLARANLDKELATFGKAEDEVRKLLATDAEWRKESHQKVQKSEKELQDSTTRLNERKDLLESHQKTSTPTIARDALIAAKEEINITIRGQNDKTFTAKHTLASDAENRKSFAVLLPQIDAQKVKTNLWLGMNDLIGSADGKKFRVFAQSLTLDLLLGMANQHLESLAPRFSLMRVPSSEMELQVIDRDMGDDIRGVNSISGGESFLVSLALALGLSSLASGTTQIGSLFIDEGFGTLDQDTLDMALSMLDSLQASGRMVGIISHIASLTERIGTRIVVSPISIGTSRVSVKWV